MTTHDTAARRGTVSSLSGSLRGLLGSLAAAAVAVCALAPAAAADEFVDRLNSAYADVRDSRRSDPIILAALANLEPPPAGVDRVRLAALQPASGGVWSEAEAWATALGQAGVIEALDQITKEPDIRRAMVFAQPYGVAAVGAQQQIELIDEGLYTSFGDPPLISAAQHLYLESFEQAGCLVQVEATRRLAEGDPAGALDVLADWVWFARSIADREFYDEKIWALEAMRFAIERMRDVAYEDFTGERVLDADAVLTAIERLADERGPLSLDRIRMPRGDFIGTEQLIATVMEPRGSVREAVFASTMARLAATDRPLRLFGEAARWQQIADVHVDWFEANDALTSLRDDYTFRWGKNTFDPLVSQPYYIERFAGSAFLGDTVAIVTRSIPDMRDMFVARDLLRVEMIGTRNALGLVGFHADNGTYPLDLSAIRPRFVPQLESDPFHPGVATGLTPPLQFFVPVRDTKDRFPAQSVVPPHEISVIVSDAPNVSIRLGEDQFVLFSVGADGAASWADEAQNTPDAPAGRDYLLWPPVLSIVRETLVQNGRYD